MIIGDMTVGTDSHLARLLSQMILHLGLHSCCLVNLVNDLLVKPLLPKLVTLRYSLKISYKNVNPGDVDLVDLGAVGVKSCNTVPFQSIRPVTHNRA